MFGMPDRWKARKYLWKSPALKVIAATKKLFSPSAWELLCGKFSGDETTIGTKYPTDTSGFEH
jgi:hypothetical protein